MIRSCSLGYRQALSICNETTRQDFEDGLVSGKCLVCTFYLALFSAFILVQVSLPTSIKHGCGDKLLVDEVGGHSFHGHKLCGDNSRLRLEIACSSMVRQWISIPMIFELGLPTSLAFYAISVDIACSFAASNQKIMKSCQLLSF
jgi:hypothetical protein